jgi:adenylylsulfate kinase-like enzyme
MAALTSERVLLERRTPGKIANTLESIASTVGRGEVLVTVAGFTGCGKGAIAGEIEIALKAIGVPVTWVNGDAEKRMTGSRLANCYRDV